MNLEKIGFNGFFKALFYEFDEQGLYPARIINQQKDRYSALMESGEIAAKVSGKFIHNAAQKSDYPAVGDWVAVSVEGDFAQIHAVLDRKSSFSRNVASGSKRKGGGLTQEQVVAANIDTVFIVTGLDDNFNLRRIERYLTLAWNSGASPVVLLNKADQCSDIDFFVEEVEAVSSGIDVHAISAKENKLDALETYLKPAHTVALLGSSGVGKSTIVNMLACNELQETREISQAVHKGRHTTTSRQLFIMENSAMLIDTPGMRELQYWGDELGISALFEDVESIAVNCRFSDCSHTNEPGCAIQKALKDGALDPKRLQNYFSLQAEQNAHKERLGKTKAQQKREWEKDIAIKVKEINKSDKRKYGR